MIQSITATCSWCEEKRHFAGEDPVREYHEAEWIQLQDYEGEDLDFCGKDCLLLWLT